jgi:hypothetical protein
MPVEIQKPQENKNKKYNFKNTLARINQCLQYKITKNWIKFDRNNLFYLGNVGFGYDDKNGTQYLIYNKDPKDWVISEVIKDIEDIEYEIYQARMSRQGML